MLPRAPLLSALLSAVVATACATPAPPPQGPVDLKLKAHGQHRTVVVKPAPAFARPSEQESVTDDPPDPEALRIFHGNAGGGPLPFAPAHSPSPVTLIA